MQHREAENYSLSSSSTLSSKNNKRYSKKCTKNKYPCLNEFIWLMTMKIMTMKIRLKMNKKSHRYDINGSSPNMDINILNVKCVLIIMMIICTAQHLNLNSWKSNWATFEAQFMEKLCNTEADLKKAMLIKKTCSGLANIWHFCIPNLRYF